jgi:hypothetical protein
LPATAHGFPPSNSRELSDDVPLQAREDTYVLVRITRASGRSK